MYKKEGGYAAAKSNVVDWTVKLTGISGLSLSRVQLSGIQKFGSTGKNKCIRTYISTRVMRNVYMYGGSGDGHKY